MTNLEMHNHLISSIAETSNRLKTNDPEASDVLLEAMNTILSMFEKIEGLEKVVSEYEEAKRIRLVKQSEGIKKAQARGVKFGRPRMPIPEDFEYVKELWVGGAISSREGARRLDISQDTFLRWCHADDLS